MCLPSEGSLIYPRAIILGCGGKCEFLLAGVNIFFTMEAVSKPEILIMPIAPVARGEAMAAMVLSGEPKSPIVLFFGSVFPIYFIGLYLAGIDLTNNTYTKARRTDRT